MGDVLHTEGGDKRHRMFHSSRLRSPHVFTGIGAGSFVGPGRPEAEAALRRELAADRLHTASQVHGATVSWEGALAEADALVTTRPGSAVAVRIADCVPILVEGPGVVAAIHAGWRGTAADIVRETLRQLRERLGVEPSRLRAAVGPAIGRDCYEVSPEVVEALAAVAPEGVDWRTGRQVDLVALNLGILRSLGVDAEAVGPCTRCSDQLWSHRRDGAAAGRQVGAIRC